MNDATRSVRLHFRGELAAYERGKRGTSIEAAACGVRDISQLVAAEQVAVVLGRDLG
jgi:hypothetical protein